MSITGDEFNYMFCGGKCYVMQNGVLVDIDTIPAPTPAKKKKKAKKARTATKLSKHA